MKQLITIAAINTSDLYKSAEILWKGLVAIAIVIALIIAATVIMNVVSRRVEKKRAENKRNDGASPDDNADK